MKQTFRPLTADETAAVTAYAAKHGKNWKLDLSDAWLAASEPGILQALRNSLGPRWLREYQLPTTLTAKQLDAVRNYR